MASPRRHEGSAASWFASRPARFGFGAVLLVVATVLPLFRQTGPRSWQTIWSEDGAIYYFQAHAQGGLAVLFRGYEGYLQLPPRLLGAPTPLLPVQDLPVYFAISSVVVSTLLAWFTYHHCRGWVESRPLRLALASLVVLMPALGQQDTANITNTIWVFAAAAPWALVSLCETRRDVVLRSVVAFLAATSSILCVMFLPLALAYALYRKTRQTSIVVATFCAGLVLQGLVALYSQRTFGELARSSRVSQILSPIPGEFGHPPLALLARYTGLEVFTSFLTGYDGTPTNWIHGDDVLLIGCTLCVAVIFAVLFPGAERKAQVLAAAFITYGLISFVVPVWYSGFAIAGLRYSVIPLMMLSSAACVLLTHGGSGGTRTVARLGRPVFVGFVVVLIVTGFRVTNPRSTEPTWTASLTRAYQTHCVGAHADRVVLVPTQAGTSGALIPFPVPLPCRDFPQVS